jgi:hypothetical protein
MAPPDVKSIIYRNIRHLAHLQVATGVVGARHRCHIYRPPYTGNIACVHRSVASTKLRTQDSVGRFSLASSGSPRPLWAASVG